MNIFLIAIIGISLAMDSFSLSLCMGSFNISPKRGLFFSSVVAMFHFLLPLVGKVVGNSLEAIMNIDANRLLFFIFLFLSFELFIQLISKDEKYFAFSLISLILLAFSVSVDSLTIGIGLSNIISVPIIGSIIFSLIAFFFTILGLIIGKYSYKKMGKIAGMIGLIIMIFLSIYYFIK